MQDVGRGPRTTSTSAIRSNSLNAENDKRFAPRRGSRTAAVITFDGAIDSFPCFILDTSVTGARIEMPPGVSNPFLSKWSDVERIWLIVRSYRIMYDCRIVRRSGAELGVRFVAAPKAITRFQR